MTFRDELDAARTRRDALKRALETSGDPEIARELAAVRAQIDAARGRAALKVLQDVRVATPCPASWAAMVGDDAVRHCALCEKNVYDFSGLTATEAVHLLIANEGNVCARLHRRRDGTLITGNCAVGRRRRRKRWLQGAAASLAIGSVAAIASPSSPMSKSALVSQRGSVLRVDDRLFFETRSERERQVVDANAAREERSQVELPLMSLFSEGHSVTMGAPRPDGYHRALREHALAGPEDDEPPHDHDSAHGTRAPGRGRSGP